jgi:arginase
MLVGVLAGAGGRTLGAEEGPAVLRELGLIRRLTDVGMMVEDLGNIPGVHETLLALDRGGSVRALHNVLQVNRHTHDCVLGARRRDPGAFLLIIGGDHSLAIGALSGLSDACRRLGILWLDAHADFNTPATSPSGNIHGMGLAIACGLGHVDLRLVGDCDPMVEPKDVILFGARDLDTGERELLAESQVRLVSVEELRRRGVAEAMREAAEQLNASCDHVHLSFDVDVMDAAFVRGTGTPAPGGLTPDEARAALLALASTGHVASAEFVEYNPSLDPDGSTGRLTLDLMVEFLAARRPPPPVPRKRRGGRG